jgi:hypothetical protein
MHRRVTPSLFFSDSSHCRSGGIELGAGLGGMIAG